MSTNLPFFHRQPAQPHPNAAGYGALGSGPGNGWLARAGMAAALGLGLLLRVQMIPFENIDTQGYLEWYRVILTQGIPSALGQSFAIYTPPYLYLLSLATLFRGFLSAAAAIKLIPILFDLLNAWLVFKIVRQRYTAGSLPYAAASIFFLLPSVMLNSAFWGQIDSIYTCFLLLTLYLLLKGHPWRALFVYGIAFAIKAQAFFLAPFLVLLLLRKRIPWAACATVPAGYIAAMLPAMFADRSLLDIMKVYLTQANEFSIPSFNAPNWYVFVPQSTYTTSMPVGFVLGGLVLGIWVLMLWRRGFDQKPAGFLLTALACVALVPFVLPKMHDRYFYPADVLSLVMAFVNPQFTILAICYQVSSLLVYSIFLFDAPRNLALMLATELNTAAVMYVVYKQWRLSVRPGSARAGTPEIEADLPA